MTDEQAFIDILKANPADDTTRLVYADWLDDRGEAGKAEYLRLTVECVVNPPAWKASAAPVARLLALGEQLAEDWRSDACGRFDLVMNSVGTPHKIAAIKAIRELHGAGLAEAARLVETLPQRIFGWLSFDSAVAIRDHLVNQIAMTDVRIQPSEIHGTSKAPSYEIHAGYWVRGEHYHSGGNREAESALEAFLKTAMDHRGNEIPGAAPNRLVLIATNLPPITLLRRLAELRAMAKRFSKEEDPWGIRVSASPM